MCARVAVVGSGDDDDREWGGNKIICTIECLHCEVLMLSGTTR